MVATKGTKNTKGDFWRGGGGRGATALPGDCGGGHGATALPVRRRPGNQGANANFLMRRMSAGSSFVNAKHLAPRSFSDAPMR